jgi:glycine/D-amino acid oxidase-like deaminating enzyme
MDLRAGYPFWLIKDGLPFSYSKLDRDIETEVVIIGGGISGALVRYYLVNAGIECVTVDARTIGLGSTCASTSLLQYEIDVPLSKLIGICGKGKAERAYHLCNGAISELGKIAKKLNFSDFKFKDSLYFAAFKKDVPSLKKEFEARKAAGFKVAFLTQHDIETKFGFSAPAAILSKHGAETNAYGLSHLLLQHKKAISDDVFDRTKIVKRTDHSHGVKLTTQEGYIIKAKKVVYATGYEVVEMLEKDVVKLLSTYAIISEQFNHMPFKNIPVMWNTADPYFYMRTTNDGRILIGGRDEDFYNPEKRDKLITKKTKQLQKDFLRLFPAINFQPEFSWSGTFGSTKDGLPYIGRYEKYPNSFFALGFGGNGITFSLIAAGIITDLILGRKNSDTELFSFKR